VITGKYIAGMTGDALIYDPESGEVRFTVDRSLLPTFGNYSLHIHVMK
jgi:hypothetical protein